MISLNAAEPVASKPVGHEVRELEGWKVHVDQRLLAKGSHADVGDLALRLLSGRLLEIVMVVPADKVARLKQVPIWLDFSHGELTSMQYHTSADWLKSNGYDPAMEKGVHIPVAGRFTAARHHHIQPWAMLHELAHAYHDQVLGFDEKELRKAWKVMVDGGKYQKTRHIAGRQVPHYALTNHKQFFAEMTEAYFGLNDFYPFQRDDLRRAEPEIFQLMGEIWGPLP